MLIAVLSDIHANLAALRAVLEDAGRAGVEEYWSLGDVVDYGPQPEACIDALRDIGALCIAGNHELAVLNDVDLERLAGLPRRLALWTRAQLTLSYRDQIAAWPVEPQRRSDRFSVVHGGTHDYAWDYISHWSVAHDCFSGFSTPYCIVGHTHVPRVFQETENRDGAVEIPFLRDVTYSLRDSRLILNPGSVGQPRDGDWRASYLLLDTARQTYCLRRVVYAVAATQALMQELDFPPGLIARLGEGC